MYVKISHEFLSSIVVNVFLPDANLSRYIRSISFLLVTRVPCNVQSFFLLICESRI